jgi:hypothetical protein
MPRPVVNKTTYVSPYLLAPHDVHCEIKTNRDMANCIVEQQRALNELNYNQNRIDELLNK